MEAHKDFPHTQSTTSLAPDREPPDARRQTLAQGWSLCRAAQPDHTKPPAHLIVLDGETTGLDLYRQDFPDEILQLSILDGSGQVLFHSYIRPYAHTSWPEAQAVNGISPEMVAHAPYLYQVAPQIKGILQGGRSAGSATTSWVLTAHCWIRRWASSRIIRRCTM